MSLTRRLIILATIAIVGLTVAALALLRLRGESDAVREATAFAGGDMVTRELALKQGQLSLAQLAAIEAGGPISPELVATSASVLAPLIDASAGYCLPSGRLAVLKTVAPLAFLPSAPARSDVHTYSLEKRPSLLQLDRDVVVEACKSHPAGAMHHIRFAAPNDLLFVTVNVSSAGMAVWALVRMPNRARDPSQRGWLTLLALLFATMAVLVVLSIDTVIAVRRGSDALAHALVDIKQDLRAKIPRPRVEELSRLADGLATMTAHLGDARERERQLERQLDHGKRLAALGRVVAGVAHEVRNPLTGLKLRLDAMARRKLDERSAKDVTRALAEVTRLDRVVGSLLLIAKRAPTALAAVDLAELAEQRLAALDDLAAARGVSLVCHGHAQAVLDSAAIARVIDNLVRNAIEASPQDGEVTLLLEETSRGVALKVSDHGSGVPKDREGELFEPFFSCKPDGTGLGLCLSRAVVESHRGQLRYER